MCCVYTLGVTDGVFVGVPGGRAALALQVVGHELALALDRYQTALLEVVAETLQNLASLLCDLRQIEVFTYKEAFKRNLSSKSVTSQTFCRSLPLKSRGLIFL